MKPTLLKNGNVLVPLAAEAEDLLGDGAVELTWEEYTEQGGSVDDLQPSFEEQALNG